MSRHTVVAPLPFVTVIAAGLGWADPAFAYIDPGSGSMILQGILAAVAAGGIAVAGCWAKVKSLFGGHSEAKPEDEQASEVRERQ